MVHLHEQLEDVRQHIRGDADAVVPHSQNRLRRLPARADQPDVSVRLGVLGRVRQQVADDLGQPHRVGVQEQRFGRKCDVEAVALDLDERLGRLDRTGDHGGEFHRLPAKFDLAPHDTGHVQQVVHQPDEVVDLPLHHVPGLLDRRRIDPWHLQDLKRVADRGQRVAKFVGQRRQELVLAAVGLPQRLVRTGQLLGAFLDPSLKLVVGLSQCRLGLACGP